MFPGAELCIVRAAELRGILPQVQCLVIDHIVQYLIGHAVIIEDGVDGHYAERLIALSETVFGHMLCPGIV